MRRRLPERHIVDVGLQAGVVVPCAGVCGEVCAGVCGEVCAGVCEGCVEGCVRGVSVVRGGA